MRAHYSKSKRCFNAKFSTYYFHMKTKILADFSICITVPLSFLGLESSISWNVSFFSGFFLNFLSPDSYFLKYKKFFRVFVSWNIMNFFGVFVFLNIRKAISRNVRMDFVRMDFFLLLELGLKSPRDGYILCYCDSNATRTHNHLVRKMV